MSATGEHGPILVVDDDPALAEMLQLVLVKEGFSTVWVGHGNDVMDVFRERKPALVLLDLMLPGRDGIQICQDIRGESGVPIIMLTARSDTPDVVRGLGAGADDYVSKPFRSAELVARIRARLRTPAAQRDEGGHHHRRGPDHRSCRSPGAARWGRDLLDAIGVLPARDDGPTSQQGVQP